MKAAQPVLTLFSRLLYLFSHKNQCSWRDSFSISPCVLWICLRANIWWNGVSSTLSFSHTDYARRQVVQVYFHYCTSIQEEGIFTPFFSDRHSEHSISNTRTWSVNTLTEPQRWSVMEKVFHFSLKALLCLFIDVVETWYANPLKIELICFSALFWYFVLKCLLLIFFA